MSRYGVYHHQIDAVSGILPASHLRAHIQKVGIVFTLVLWSMFSMPLLIYAQTNSSTTPESQMQLEASIRNALLSDPRASQLPPKELESMVHVLSASAQKEGITQSDIEKAQSVTSTKAKAPTSTSDVCLTTTPAFICALAEAYGLDGSNLLPFWLAGSAALLILIIGTMLEIHHLAHKKTLENTSSIPPSNT